MSQRSSPQQSLQTLLDPTVCHVSGCHIEVDILLKSSDGILWGAHAKNLETFSSGFPPAEFRKSSGSPDIVSLPESSDIVLLLLDYMHHQRQPDSSTFTFDVLSRLAEATEKYMIFSATEVCKIRMKEYLSEHPIPILKFAVLHNYPELSELAAPHTISFSLDAAKGHLQDKPNIFFAWIQYRERWLQMLPLVFGKLSLPEKPRTPSTSKAQSVDDYHSCKCGLVKWPRSSQHIIQDNTSIERCLGILYEVLTERDARTSGCQSCQKAKLGHWHIVDSWPNIATLPKFSSFL